MLPQTFAPGRRLISLSTFQSVPGDRLPQER
jgi:hypothetical protein